VNWSFRYHKLEALAAAGLVAACFPLGSCSSAESRDGGQDGGSDDAGSNPGMIPVLLIWHYALVAEAICDHDGDGRLDNSTASLDGFVLESLNGVLQDPLDANSTVITIDVSGVEDPDTPHDPDGFTSALIPAYDCDQDPRDNSVPGEILDAHRSFTAVEDGRFVPLFTAPATLDHGRFSAHVEEVPLTLFGTAVSARDTVFSGTISPGLESMDDGRVCIVLDPGELSAIPFPADESFSILDALVAPGHWASVLYMDGIQPTVDVDGEGLESFIADESGHVTACVLEDGTLLENDPLSPCAQHEDMADGIALAMHSRAVSAWLVVPAGQGTACPD